MAFFHAEKVTVRDAKCFVSASAEITNLRILYCSPLCISVFQVKLKMYLIPCVGTVQDGYAIAFLFHLVVWLWIWRTLSDWYCTDVCFPQWTLGSFLQGKARPCNFGSDLLWASFSKAVVIRQWHVDLMRENQSHFQGCTELLWLF